MATATPVPSATAPRHAAFVRVTHWITVVAFAALLLSGLELVISHPRFYWGEAGHSLMKPLFTLPIPSSRGSVPTGYGYVLPDQNGWSRALHFEAAWALLLAGLVYTLRGLWTGHFRRHLVPARADRNWRAVRDVLAASIRWPAPPSDPSIYNVVQCVSYVLVLVVLFPLMIWTGLALSPAFAGAFPFAVHLLGGRQSARTLHFFDTWLLVLFVVAHIAMVAHGGFRHRMRAMITGKTITADIDTADIDVGRAQ